VQGFVGRDVVREVRKEARNLYIVAEMSHPGNADFISGNSEKIAIMARRKELMVSLHQLRIQRGSGR